MKIVGAASKGIIKREHQHNAVVYHSTYATNPFDKMSNEELKEYEDAVRRGEKPPKDEVLADIQQQLQGSIIDFGRPHKTVFRSCLFLYCSHCTDNSEMMIAIIE